MFEPNALTDAIALTIAVSFALRPAIGLGVSGMLGLWPFRGRRRPRGAMWSSIVAGMLLGAVLGGIAWRGDGDARWIAIGALAGLLAGAGEARTRTGRECARYNDGPACRCACGSHRWH